MPRRSLATVPHRRPCRETTHEPVENLEEVEDVWRIGSKVFLQSDGPEFYGVAQAGERGGRAPLDSLIANRIGEIFEYQDDMAVAGLKNLSEKLNNLGCGCAARALLPLSSPPSLPRPLDPLPFTLRRAHPHRREQTHEPVENLKLLS